MNGNTEHRSDATWSLRRRCYRPAVFFLHVHLNTLSVQQKKKEEEEEEEEDDDDDDDDGDDDVKKLKKM